MQGELDIRILEHVENGMSFVGIQDSINLATSKQLSHGSVAVSISRSFFNFFFIALCLKRVMQTPASPSQYSFHSTQVAALSHVIDSYSPRNVYRDHTSLLMPCGYLRIN